VVTALDASADALSVARSNDPDGRVEWLHSDGFTGVASRVFDLIVSNPPYVAEADMTGLAPELGHEPRSALVAGPTGLECYRAITAQAPTHLAAGGRLLFEVGAGQADDVAGLLRDAGFTDVETRDDLAGITRVVGGR